jgi:predicted metal-dependent peptidase
MKDPILEKLTTARIGLLLKTPFFGNMATRMKIIDASDWCPTAATDGRNFFYNKDFVEKLSHKKLEFLFAHEIGHCVFDHFGRAGSRNRQLCNISQDYAINQILVDERIGEKISEVDICYDPKYRGLAWEEIYDQLYTDAEKNGMSLDELMEKLGDLLDEHINEDSQGGEGKDGKGNKPVLSKEERQKIKDEIKEAMIQSAAAAGAGKTPAAIQRLIKDLTEPKMDWREVLQMNIQSIIKNDYSFQRPNRKSQSSGIYLPGMKNDETIDVAIAMDMSGSIGMDDAKVFLSEVKGIMDQYVDFNIKIWSFDTEVYNFAEFSADGNDDITTYEPKGGGGTDFKVNWDFMKENGIEPKKFIMFTDGYPWDSWGDPEYCDTLFIVKGGDNTAPFGETVKYDREFAQAA